MSKPKHDKKPILLDIDRMSTDPSMKGMLSFLEPPSATPLPYGPGPRLLPARPSVSEDAVLAEKGDPKTGHPVSGDPEMGDPVSGSPILGYPSLRPFRQITPQPCRTAQDGHTHGEQNVYAAMFRLGTPMGQGTSRHLLIGLPTLARSIPMKYDSCLANIRSLQEKYSIERRVAERHNDGHYYIVYGYREIMDRRRRAGLTHFLRHGWAVKLLPAPGPPEMGYPKMGDLSSQDGIPQDGRPSVEMGYPVTGVPSLQDGSPVSGDPLRSKQEEGITTTTIVTQLLQIFGRSDDDAAERIIRSCRQASPDLTDDELVFFLNREGRRFLVMPGVTNPLGLLIKHLPKAASGESLRQHREAARSAAANDLAMARDVLADQESPEPLREWAQNILKGAGN